MNDEENHQDQERQERDMSQPKLPNRSPYDSTKKPENPCRAGHSKFGLA